MDNNSLKKAKSILLVSVLLNLILGMLLIIIVTKKEKPQTTNSEEPIISNKLYYEDIKCLLDSLKLTGSYNAYSQLSNYYLEERVPGEMLPVALIMANKWNNAYEGMFEVYLQLLDLYNISLDKGNFEDIDSKSLSMALSYLIDGYECESDTVKKKAIYYHVDYFINNGYIIERNNKLFLNE